MEHPLKRPFPPPTTTSKVTCVAELSDYRLSVLLVALAHDDLVELKLDVELLPVLVLNEVDVLHDATGLRRCRQERSSRA